MRKSCLALDAMSSHLQMICTGSPWYYDGIEEKVVRFSSSAASGTQSSTCCGAALILTSSVAKGDELLLDYGLREPLPKWARDWYTD